MKRDSSKVVVRQASLEELLSVHECIPEFGGKEELDFYRNTLEDRVHLSLVAIIQDELAGFKVGYVSDNPDIFYSWMGGVVPQFRRDGVATALAEYQENWARNNGFRKIFFKTRNRFPLMINFGISRNFKIIEVIQKDTIDDYRIVMMKEL